MARLEMLRDNRTTKEYPLGDNTLIGRKSDCDICVPSPKASREHCRIFKTVNGFVIEDLSSSNGTIVNNAKIANSPLKHLDTIHIGGIAFRFLDRDEDSLIGKTLGKYLIHEKIGNGGMGIVYLAEQTGLGRKVALKVMNPKFAEKPDFIESFEREAKIAARLQHPNIIGIHDFGYDRKWYYFSMELVEGENLLDMIQRDGKVSPAELLPIAIEIADALDHAHTHNVLHKDIKPQNIMLTRDKHVKLADLGLASLMHQNEEAEDQPDGKPVMATPQYVPPEIVKRKDVDPRSDIYSFAATLYHALTGKAPYSAPKLNLLLKMHLNAPVPDPRDVEPKIPETLAQFVMRGMQKNPEDRQQSANLCKLELEKIYATLNAQPGNIDNNIDVTIQSKRRPAEKPLPGKTSAAAAIKKNQIFKQRIINLLNNKILQYSIAGLFAITALGVFWPESAARKADRIWLNLAPLMEAMQTSSDSEKIAGIRLDLDEVIKHSPNPDYVKQAKEKLDFFSRSVAIRTLYTIRAQRENGKLPPDNAKKAIEGLFELSDLPIAERAEIVQYYQQIGGLVNEKGEIDTRAGWERQCSRHRNNGDWKAAYLAAYNAWQAAQGPEKSRALDLKNEFSDKMIGIARDEFEQAKEFCKRKLYKEASMAFKQTRCFFADAPEADGQKAWEIACKFAEDNIVRKLTDYQARGWQDFIRCVEDTDGTKAEQTAREALARLGNSCRRNSAGRMMILATSVNGYFQALLNDAEKNTRKDLDRVTAKVDGEIRKVSLKAEDGILYAVGKKHKIPIKIKDLQSTGDIKLIARASGISSPAAFGGMVYMRLREPTAKNIDYYKAVLNTEDRGKLLGCFEEFQTVLRGDVLVFNMYDLPGIMPEQFTRKEKDYRIYLNKAGYTDIIPWVLNLRPGTSIIFNADSGVGLKLSAGRNNNLQINRETTRLVVSGMVAGTPLTISAVGFTGGTLNIGFSDNQLTIRNNNQVLSRIAVPNIQTWNAGIGLTVDRAQRMLNCLKVYYHYPQLVRPAKGNF